MSTRGLGPRGREALFASNIQEKQDNDVFKELPILLLSPCVAQPRKQFNEENLKELANSIQEKGIVQPLVVRRLAHNKYEIVAGERRWRAAKLLGLDTVPVIIRDYSDADVMTIALVENIQRENLNPMEEAEAFALLKDKYSLSQEELAKSLGKSRPRVANTLRLLNLPNEMRKLVLEDKISGAHGRTLLALHNQDLLETLALRIQQYHLSVRDTENMVEYANAYNRLPELLAPPSSSAQESVTSLEQGVSAVKSPAKRKVVSKSQVFAGFQKNLRSHFHRGTRVSGTLENGKITFPFSGEAELKHLLKLLSLGSMIESLDLEDDTLPVDSHADFSDVLTVSDDIHSHKKNNEEEHNSHVDLEEVQ